jgi:trehalose 6-phosphate synthase
MLSGSLGPPTGRRRVGHDRDVSEPAPGATADPFVLVSNRGPLRFESDGGGTLVSRRGAGGLVSGLAPLVSGTDTVWISAAMSDGDRVAASRGTTTAHGFRTRLLALDPDMYRMAYDVIGNATLWFVHHGLYDLARRPRFDDRFRTAWDAYREVNRVFADAVAADAPTGAAVLVQDYHLSLMGPMLAERRPDLRTVHFSHTPFAGPDLMRVLPDAVGAELLEGLAGHHRCGFHTQRWADAFGASCRELIGREPPTFVAPLATDPDDLAEVAGSDACRTALAELDRQVGDRALIVRVDRIELSKNLLRGFHAYDDLLARHPEWRGRVVFGAFLYPSREGLPEYLAYRQEVETVIEQVNRRWGTPDWVPILADLADDYARSVAALRRFDVLLVNPIRDGLNLVATEGALVNERDGLVLLSPEAGAWSELEGAVRRVHPYDISGTADALADALSASPAARATEAAELRWRAGLRRPADWLAGQLSAASA